MCSIFGIDKEEQVGDAQEWEQNQGGPEGLSHVGALVGVAVAAPLVELGDQDADDVNEKQEVYLK